MVFRQPIRSQTSKNRTIDKNAQAMNQRQRYLNTEVSTSAKTSSTSSFAKRRNDVNAAAT